MSRVAFPFLTLSEAAVNISQWSISVNGGEWLTAGDYLQDWDAASTIRIQRRISVDPSIAAIDLDIAVKNLAFLASVRIGTGQGRLPRLILARETHCLSKPSWSADFDFEIEGVMLSNILSIDTRILLAAPVSKRNLQSLSPSRIGDKLWAHQTKVNLEGEEPRFPIEVADIQALLGDTVSALAPWYLHWSPKDWSRDFHGAMRLYLNGGNLELVERIKQEDPVIIQMLMADVMGQVCERLVSDSELEDLFNSPEPGSLGAQAVSWLKKAWPGKNPDFIKSVLQSRPGIFRSAILALGDLGGK